MLKVSHLGYKRNHQIIFRNITFELKPGSWIQVSGPNGSGKTTLLKILAGLLEPTRGNIEWQRKDSEDSKVEWQDNKHPHDKQKIGWDLQYLSQIPSLYAGLTAAENLNLHARLSTDEKVIKNSEFLRIEKLCGQLSAGQRQKLCLERLKNKSARLWLLDEPLNSLDKEGIEGFKQQFNQHLERGGMIVLASHMAFEADKPRDFEICL